MESGLIIAQFLQPLPQEFKNLLKRKDKGEITQRQLEDQCDAYTLAKLNSLDPKPEPTKPWQVDEYENMGKREQKEADMEIIREKKSEYLAQKFTIAAENELNLRELRRLLGKYKTSTEAEKILSVITRHKTFYPPFREPVKDQEGIPF